MGNKQHFDFIFTVFIYHYNDEFLATFSIIKIITHIPYNAELIFSRRILASIYGKSSSHLKINWRIWMFNNWSVQNQNISINLIKHFQWKVESGFFFFFLFLGSILWKVEFFFRKFIQCWRNVCWWIRYFYVCY